MFIRRARSITNPSFEELQALGAIVARLEKQDQDLRMQESWLSSKSLIRTQIMRLRAQLNELKQIRYTIYNIPFNAAFWRLTISKDGSFFR